MTDGLTSEELQAVKERQPATWNSGDYALIGTRLQIVGESLCEAVDVSAGWKVLDVAAGNGNASLAAARDQLVALADSYNRNTDGTLTVPADYLEVVATRR